MPSAWDVCNALLFCSHKVRSAGLHQHADPVFLGGQHGALRRNAWVYNGSGSPRKKTLSGSEWGVSAASMSQQVYIFCALSSLQLRHCYRDIVSLQNSNCKTFQDSKLKLGQLAVRLFS